MLGPKSMIRKCSPDTLSQSRLFHQKNPTTARTTTTAMIAAIDIGMGPILQISRA